jgi:hypothetical protein
LRAEVAASPAGADFMDFGGFADFAGFADIAGVAGFADFAAVLAGAVAACPAPGFARIGRFVVAPVAFRIVVLVDFAAAVFPTAFAADFFVADVFATDFPVADFFATACLAAAFLVLRATTVFAAA